MEWILFVIGCILIIKSSDIIVDSASAIAVKLKVPKMLIALTVVSFGTCAPEIAISFNSVMSSNGGIASANVIGSCIVNVLLIIGIASFFNPIKVRDETVKKQLPLLLIITIAFIVMMMDNFFFKKALNVISRADGIVLLLFFAVFILYLVRMSKIKNKDERKIKAKYGILKASVYLVISILVIILSADLIVDNAIIIAEKLGVSQKIITMIIVVIGTSLPELVMTASAAKKKEYDMAIGNIIGTNIFNICVVMGLPIVIFGGIEVVSFNYVDMVILFSSSFLLFMFARSEHNISRVEGIIMLLLFIAYYTYIIVI